MSACLTKAALGMKRLAFDIETLGLLHEVPLPEITCVCMCDDDGNDYCFRIWNDVNRAKNEEAIIQLLDQAEIICGYNAVQFDLEYIRRVMVVSDEKMTAWVRKCLDPYMFALYITCTPCKLQHMLELNNLSSKTASGGDAIVMAREDRWDELIAYCLMDAKLTLSLCQLEWIHFTASLQGRLRADEPPQFRFFTKAAPLLSIAPKTILPREDLAVYDD